MWFLFDRKATKEQYSTQNGNTLLKGFIMSEKLVRDDYRNLPSKDGVQYTYRTVEGSELLEFLFKKRDEEWKELMEARALEDPKKILKELGDVLDVDDAIRDQILLELGNSLDAFEWSRISKIVKFGRFGKGLIQIKDEQPNVNVGGDISLASA